MYLFFLSAAVLIQNGYYVVGNEYISLNGLIENEKNEREIEKILEENSIKFQRLLPQNYFKENNYKFVRPYHLEKDIFIDFLCINVLEDEKDGEFLENIAKKDDKYYQGDYSVENGKITYNANFARKYCEKYNTRLPMPQELEIALNYYKIAPCFLNKIKNGNSMEYVMDNSGLVYVIILRSDLTSNYKIMSIYEANTKFENMPFRCIRDK